MALSYKEGNINKQIRRKGAKHGAHGESVRVMFSPILCVRVSDKNKKEKTAKANETSYELASVWLKQELGHKKN